MVLQFNNHIAITHINMETKFVINPFNALNIDPIPLVSKAITTKQSFTKHTELINS